MPVVRLFQVSIDIKLYLLNTLFYQIKKEHSIILMTCLRVDQENTITYNINHHFFAVISYSDGYFSCYVSCSCGIDTNCQKRRKTTIDQELPESFRVHYRHSSSGCFYL